jgi:glucuronate isomerase
MTRALELHADRLFPADPARHDLARRVECSELALLVSEHRIAIDEAHQLAEDCAHRLVSRAYRL